MTINNETLFNGFRRGRRLSRSAWSPNRRGVVISSHAPQVSTEPVEIITEIDVVDDSVYGNCGECGIHDYAAMFDDGICSYCLWRNELEWRETMAAIDRAERAGMSSL